MIVDHAQETRKRKFPHENFLPSPNIHPDLIGHITKKVKLNAELMAPDKTIKSMNNLMKMLTLEDQTKCYENKFINGNIPFQLHKHEVTNFQRKFQKIKGYDSIIKNKKKNENEEIDFDSLLCDASNLRLNDLEPIWNVFQYFKSELKVLEGKDFEELFEGLKEKISDFIKTIHVEDMNNQGIAKKSSQEVQDIFVMIFKRIIFGFEDLWSYLTAFLRLEYTLPSLEDNKYHNTFASMKEEIEHENQSNAFAVTLTNVNVEDLPIFVIKVKNEDEYELENEKDMMYSQMRSIAQNINARELYGLLAADRRVRFVKYEIVQGQGERLLISASFPFIPEELLQGTGRVTQVDGPLKLIICMLLESVKKYNT